MALPRPCSSWTRDLCRARRRGTALTACVAGSSFTHNSCSWCWQCNQWQPGRIRSAHQHGLRAPRPIRAHSLLLGCACATQIGLIDGSLGACGSGACLSSYDDRPQHALEPWTYEAERSRDTALAKLEQCVRRQVGSGVLAMGA